MATPLSISARGTITSLLSLGFTDQDALNEMLDNSFDADTEITRVRLNTPDTTLYVDDAACGMDKTALARSLCIYSGKPAADGVSGLFGLGVKAAHAVLSNERAVTRILSRVLGGEDVCEIAADWPNALAHDVWHPTATEITARRKPLWDAGCLDPERGTVMVIPMPPAKYHALAESLPQMRKDIGRTYEQHLRRGKRIVIELDGVAHLPDMSDALNWEDAPAHLRAEVPIEVWEHSETHAIRVYYEHHSLRPIWTDMVRVNPENPKKKPLRDHDKAAEQGFVRTGRFVMRSVYNPAWNPRQPEDGPRPAWVPGYIAFRRHGRSLRPIAMEMSAMGDYERRRVVAASRHAVDFDHTADKLVGVEVNKSNITPENICPALFATVKRLAAEWAGRVYETSFKVRAERGDIAFERRLKRVMKSLKQLSHEYRDDFLDELESLIDGWADDEDDEASVDGGAA